MRVLVELWRSTVGRKALVALSGLLLGMWVVLHLLGNLTVFSGAATADRYAAALQQIPAWLWMARAGLAVAAVVHVAGVVSLTRANQAAASAKSASDVPGGGGTGRSPGVEARGYEPRKRTSAQIRRSPIRASPTRASLTCPVQSRKNAYRPSRTPVGRDSIRVRLTPRTASSVKTASSARKNRKAITWSALNSITPSGSNDSSRG